MTEKIINCPRQQSHQQPSANTSISSLPNCAAARCNGFWIRCSSQLSMLWQLQRNIPSALEQPHVVDDYLRRKIAESGVAGPFDTCITIEHLAGSHNITADQLSKHNMQSFLIQIPAANTPHSRTPPDNSTA